MLAPANMLAPVLGQQAEEGNAMLFWLGLLRQYVQTMMIHRPLLVTLQLYTRRAPVNCARVLHAI